MFGYLAIVLTALAAFFGAPVWAFLVGAAALMVVSALEHRRIAANATWESLEALHWATWHNAGQAVLASGGAYVLGHLVRLSF